MSVYVYRRASSNGARELAEAIGGRRHRGTAVPIQQKARRGDVVVCWGEELGNLPGVTVINGAPVRSKYTDAVMLRQAGVPTIEVSQTQPRSAPARPAVDPAAELFEEVQELADAFTNIETFRRSNVLATGVGELRAAFDRLSGLLAQPAPVAPPPAVSGEWIGRSNSHVGGNDLLTPVRNPDYYARKEQLVSEFRVHSFAGKSIRAGIKAPREGVARPHEWIRSYDAGWSIRYDGVSSKKAHRELAHRACTTLGLTFGAVDIGQKADGSLIVLEVNRCPGLEGGTVTAYAEAVRRMIGA